MKEANLSRLIAVAIGKLRKTTVFRNNVGIGWQGSKVSLLSDGRRIIDDPRPLHAGLCDGSSDLIGWTEVEIRPDMVGKKIAVFTAIEIKVPGSRGASAKQLNFIQQVSKAGGIAGIAHDPDEAVGVIENATQPTLM